jgi:hypothetical protein
MAKPQKFKKYLNKIGTFIIPFISKSWNKIIMGECSKYLIFIFKKQ